ncbi:MAG: family 16 glycosylhydrolase [Candidatus Saganbacteria bacterium]|nr:family 16 glycosylhydrolase [Candidatus Saganbacteria bacterium]
MGEINRTETKQNVAAQAGKTNERTINLPDEKSRSSMSGPVIDDGLDRFDRDIWSKAHGWANGAPFNNGWRSDHVAFENGRMVLTLDNTASSGKPYTSGEYRTKDFYGYGTLEASIKAAAGEGIMGGSLFFCTGPYDNNPWDEIDIEIIKGKMQVNYITNGNGNNERTIELGFDPSKAFHTYKIEWRPDMIIWSVDEKEVHRENGSRSPLPKTPGRIIANLWTGKDVDGWLGKFEYRSPLRAEYDWIKYTPFKDKTSGCNK